MEELTYKDLLEMVGQKVLVVDTVPLPNGEPRPNQYCTIFLSPSKLLSLDNGAYKFEYDIYGNCVDGEFYVFPIEEYFYEIEQ